MAVDKFFREFEGGQKADIEFESAALVGPPGYPPTAGNVFITLSYLDVRLGELGGIMSTGVIVAFGGTAAPVGWLLCDGTAVSRATYAALFQVIDETFGVGDGSTTFNVPDMRQRLPLGKAAAGTGSVLGGTGGEIDHDHSNSDHNHSLVDHNHSLVDHNHSVANHQHGVTGPSGGPSATIAVQSGAGTTVPTETHTHTLPANTDNDGGLTSGDAGAGNTGNAGAGNTGDAGAVNTGTENPPFLSVNYIIKI